MPAESTKPRLRNGSDSDRAIGTHRAQRRFQFLSEIPTHALPRSTSAAPEEEKAASRKTKSGFWKVQRLRKQGYYRPCAVASTAQGAVSRSCGHTGGSTRAVTTI